MVLHEQFVVPFHALVRRPDLIVFPYNSCSVLLSLSPRTVCVIHDLIPYRPQNRGSALAFAYVACTARWHARLGRRFVAVSPFTARTLRALPRFRGAPVITVPNCFTAAPPASDPASLPAPRRRVTLISGVGPNKDFARALELMAAAESRMGGLAFDVVGFGSDHPRATAMVEEARGRGLRLPELIVHPLLPRAELDAMLAANAVTWAHSRAEGFGRVVVEGRLAGRPVVMSRLPVFRTLADPFTFTYANGDADAFVSGADGRADRPGPTLPAARRIEGRGVGRLQGAARRMTLPFAPDRPAAPWLRLRFVLPVLGVPIVTFIGLLLWQSDARAAFRALQLCVGWLVVAQGLWVLARVFDRGWYEFFAYLMHMVVIGAACLTVTFRLEQYPRICSTIRWR